MSGFRNLLFFVHYYFFLSTCFVWSCLESYSPIVDTRVLLLPGIYFSLDWTSSFDTSDYLNTSFNTGLDISSLWVQSHDTTDSRSLAVSLLFIRMVLERLLFVF